MMERYLDARSVDMNTNNKIRKTKFCPMCGSSNIEWVLPQTWSKWECRDCGYVGSFIIEDSSIAEEIRRDYLRRKKEDGDEK